MSLPSWAYAPDAPKDTFKLTLCLTEALAVAAEARGYRAFADMARKTGIYDLYLYLCQRAWHDPCDWEAGTFHFWVVFSDVATDDVMVDLFDTLCSMTPLGDLNDEEEADAYWPDLIATVRGLCEKTLN